jgi:hypothetical protein
MISKDSHSGTTGVLLVDQIGLAIESSGNLDKSQSGLMSSIMKNTARLQQILSDAANGGGGNNHHSDRIVEASSAPQNNNA